MEVIKLGGHVPIGVIDVNGDTGLDSECRRLVTCRQRMFKTQYIPIIERDDNTMDENKSFYVKMPDGKNMLRNKSNSLVWAHNTEQWENRTSNIALAYISKDTTGHIVYNHINTVFATVRLTEVLFDFNPSEFVKSHPTSFHKSIILIMNHDIATEMGYIPTKASACYIRPKKTYSSSEREILGFLMQKRAYPTNIATTYHADEHNPIVKIVNKAYAKTNYKITAVDVMLAKLMGGYTFGQEFETVGGKMPMPIVGNLGLVPLIDGSIGHDNYEYTSIVQQGAKGIAAIRAQCQALTEFCNIDSKCAFHLHIGGFENSKLNTLSIAALCHRLQGELYAMMPYYKQDEIGIMGKSKNYSRPLPDFLLSDNNIFDTGSKEEFKDAVFYWYNRLWKFYACGQDISPKFSPSDRKDKYRGGKLVQKASPKPPWNRQWNCPTRYYWANFINMMFTKTGTVEFRIHEPTLNAHKVLPWLMICSAIVRYATTYPRRVLQYREKIKLKDVISEIATDFGNMKNIDPNNKSYPQLFAEDVAGYINEYIQNRKEVFSENYAHAYASDLNRNNHAQSINMFSVMAQQLFQGDAHFKFEGTKLKSLF